MTIRESRIPLESRREWEAALAGLPHAFAHTWGYCHAIQQTTGARTYRYAFEDGRARAVCPVAERVFDGATDVVTPYGIAGFTGAATGKGLLNDWRSFATKMGYV